MTGNQSGAEKDNRLLFREHWILLFSKSKMAATNSSQKRADLKIQDGGTHESKFILENNPPRLDGIRCSLNNSLLSFSAPDWLSVWCQYSS